LPGNQIRKIPDAGMIDYQDRYIVMSIIPGDLKHKCGWIKNKYPAMKNGTGNIILPDPKNDTGLLRVDVAYSLR